MEDPTRGRHELNLASRKAEEADWRRFQATQWLESLVGPLGLSTQPSEREFISCLRNGLIICNAINKIKPGSVPKVVESHSPSQSLTWDSQPLPAYQYFENVRNFLVAVEELKLPAFEASDLERDNLEAGSSAKVVDCILALKAYYEWKQMSGGNGFFKPPRSPLVKHSASRIHSRASGALSSEPSRQLELSAGCDNQPLAESETQKLEDSIVRALVECMVDTKENIDDNILAFFRNGNPDPVKLFNRVMSSCLEKQLQNKVPELKSVFINLLGEGSSSVASSMSIPLENLSSTGNRKCCSACMKEGNCNHWQLFQMQEKELSTNQFVVNKSRQWGENLKQKIGHDIVQRERKKENNLKVLLSRTKREFQDLQSQLQSDLKQLGSQVQELSTAAFGYHKVVKENRNLYNMVQDLRGNIRVYCRIRPPFSTETKNVIDFIGKDGSLVILDPLKSQKVGRKVFQFNHVFGPTATQDEVFRDTEPLIRSVMDGYNVCIFAYGQTGSGKTHTMYGPSGGSTKDLGINYLALNDLFQLSNRRKDITEYDIHVQMVEIYNEQVRDLLADESSTTNKLEIRSCTGENGLSLPDATMHSVKSTADVLNLMKLGEVNRVVSSTAINNQSSRSHSVLTVHVHGKDVSRSIVRSCLHLVDLAGSERVDKSEVTGDGLKEAQYINKSLSCLGDVITALAQKNSHIPYRNSKLTLLLQNSLGGHAKTLMFAHVSPEGDSFGETISTLKFAQRVSTVELGAARANKESSEVMQLKEQLKSLKKALANKEAQTLQHNKPKEPRSPFEKPKATADRTPPRPQRLSIENCSTMKMEKTTNFEDNKGPKTPSVPTQSRRSSLEGPRHINKDPGQIKISEAVSNHIQLEATSSQKCRQLQDTEAVSKSYSHISHDASMVNVYHQKAPRSPTSFAYRSQVVKTGSGTKIRPFQLPKTPEPPVLSRDEVQIMMQSELKDSQTPILTTSTNGKGSQIRKSLRTIGKLINGSEKRNQQKRSEARSPINGMSSIQDERSPPISASARALRRQSLTGIQTSDKSRRSSLGGNSANSCTNETRNAKTPPPVRASSKVTKRQL